MKYFPFIILLCVTACALPQEPERTVYGIDAKNIPSTQAIGPRQASILRIAVPHSVTGLDSERIQVQEKDGSLTWVKNAQWIAPPAKMLQPILVRDLESSGLFSAIVDDRSPANAAFVLETSVERFTVVEGDKADIARVEIALRFTLVKIPENRLIMSRLVTSSEPVETLRMAYIVPAFETALGHCVQQSLVAVRTAR